MKLYDFDGMFDEKLGEYVKNNADKYRESEWENIIPALYKKFGDTFIKSVGDTPNGFYAKMSDEELVTALKTHLKSKCPFRNIFATQSKSGIPFSFFCPFCAAVKAKRSMPSTL